MKYQKGQSGNPAGKKPGTISNSTIELRKFLSCLVENNQEKFNKEFLKLSGREFIDRFIALLEYCTPKLNRTDLVSDGDKISCINISDAELVNRLFGIVNKDSQPGEKKADN